MKNKTEIETNALLTIEQMEQSQKREVNVEDNPLFSAYVSFLESFY